jgi:DNA (cytosine-5)-methyltransferase 1
LTFFPVLAVSPLGLGKSLAVALNQYGPNDFDEGCVESYNANFGDHCTHGEINGLLKDPGVTIKQL